MADRKKGTYEAPSPANDKKKALETALLQIEKNYGKGAVMRLGDKPEMQVDAIPTGSLALDAALGSAVCRAAESLKSMVRSPLVRQRWHCTFWPLRRRWAERSPLWTQNMHWIRTMRLRWAWTSMPCWCLSRTPVSRHWRSQTHWVRSGAVDAVVVDSVAALTPRAEIEGEMGDSFVGLHGPPDVSGTS